MARPDRFAACVAEVLRHEGGYVDHPRDPGGCTNRGVTRRTFDAAVNSGRRRAALWLQQALGVTADGVIGPQTLRAARGANDRAAVISRACELRLAFLRILDTWPDFGRGWSRRVREVRAAALAMAGAA
jgi:lysozyme family protein